MGWPFSVTVGPKCVLEDLLVLVGGNIVHPDYRPVFTFRFLLRTNPKKVVYQYHILNGKIF